MAARIEAARRAMADAGLDALLLLSGPNLAYLSGAGVVEPTAGRTWYLLVPKTGDPALVVQDWRRKEAAQKAWVRDVRSYRRLSNVPFDILDALWDRHRLGGAKVGMELGNEMRLAIPVLDFEELRRHYSGTGFVDASELLWRLRMIKEPQEIECIRRACEVTAEAYRQTFAAVRAGTRHSDIVCRMKSSMLAAGGADPWVLASFGPGNYDFGSASVDRSPVEPGDLVWMDSGCTVGGYWSDFSRAAVAGRATGEQRDLQRALHEITARGVEMIGPGRPVAEIAAYCDEAVETLGAPVTTKLSILAGRIGHGLGLDVTELPHIAQHDETVLEPGMVITVEPGVATAYGTFHVEENVVVTPEGHEVLSVSPRELVEVLLT